MKRDKKGIKEKLVKWINRIASKEIEKDNDKKQLSYKTTINSTKKLRIIEFLVLFFLHGPEDHEINKQNMSTEPP